MSDNKENKHHSLQVGDLSHECAVPAPDAPSAVGQEVLSLPLLILQVFFTNLRPTTKRSEQIFLLHL